ncbi:MAG: hypothetical protein C0605_09730 [Hyphomicrobiales bacterium]|nr:MAG: hypothetical protein C0605_09730 [Hyphomicrobiales bacterium]
MNTASDRRPPDLSIAFGEFCPEVQFAEGHVLRRKGVHYADMYILLEGEASVDVEPDTHQMPPIRVVEGDMVGEIGFLRGVAATATVIALTPLRALVVDDATLRRIEKEAPDLAVAFHRDLVHTADDRTAFNLAYGSEFPHSAEAKEIEVLLCRNEEMLRSAQALRYEVYCRELGRDSPNADHEMGIIRDELDAFSHTLIAVCDEEVVGTLRAAFTKDGPLGIIESLYCMQDSEMHPHATGISNKFIVKRSERGGPAAIKLVAGLARFARRHDIRECYMDCVPQLLHYYRALGFKVAGPEFMHAENGPSIPLKIDLLRYNDRLCAEMNERRKITLFVKAAALKLLGRFGRSGAGA